MKNGFEQLRDLDVDGLNELAGFEFHAPGATPTLNAGIGLASDLKLARKPARRKFIDARQVESVIATIGKLPAPGETYHIVICGKSSLWDVVPATLQLAGAGSRIRRLYVATLGFSQRNTEELLALIDAGRIQECRFLCSHYFKGTSESLYTPMHDGLIKRRQTFLAMRNHAKILLIQLADGKGGGRRFSVEGSANLRSCKNVEQFSFTQDRRLFDFHARWMDELFAAAAPRPATKPGTRKRGKR
jgi:hypothetical protein